MSDSPSLHWSVNNFITHLLESVPSFVVVLGSEFSFIHHIVSPQSHSKPVRISVWFKRFYWKDNEIKSTAMNPFYIAIFKCTFNDVHKIYPRRKRNATKKKLLSLRTVTAKCAFIIILWLFHNFKKKIYSRFVYGIYSAVSLFYDRLFGCVLHFRQNVSYYGGCHCIVAVHLLYPIFIRIFCVCVLYSLFFFFFFILTIGSFLCSP